MPSNLATPYETPVSTYKPRSGQIYDEVANHHGTEAGNGFLLPDNTLADNYLLKGSPVTQRVGLVKTSEAQEVPLYQNGHMKRQFGPLEPDNEVYHDHTIIWSHACMIQYGPSGPMPWGPGPHVYSTG